MPEDNNEDINQGMERVQFSVPAPLYQDFLELAKKEGWRPSELNRIFWERGFACYSEGSNKRLVNKSLRKKDKSSEPE